MVVVVVVVLVVAVSGRRRLATRNGRRDCGATVVDDGDGDTDDVTVEETFGLFRDFIEDFSKEVRFFNQ